jgi:hypothetical protein
MSSLSADLRETTSSDVQLRRVQYRWTTMLRRADARESALANALAHARERELQLQGQLLAQERRHTIERRLLRDRLQRLEQCLLGYTATTRKALSSPLAALRDSGKLLSPAVESPKRMPLIAAPTSNQSAAAILAPAQIPAQIDPTPKQIDPAPEPFDPAAIVASMLPLNDQQPETHIADLYGALDRLRGIVSAPDMHRPSEHRIKTELSTIAPSRPTPAPLQLAPPPTESTLEQPEPEPLERDVPAPVRPRVGDSETPWFPRAFRRLAEEDPESAGRLLLQLLPTQGLVWPEDVAYRIEVAETGTLAVDVTGGRSTVQALLEPGATRPGETTLRFDLAGLARAATGRRGWSRVGARIAASRHRHLRPLRALAAAPLELSDIRRAGAKPDPVLLLRLLALAIDPRWTSQEIFTVACRWRGRVESACYIHVFESAPVAVTSAPPIGRVAATLTCEPQEVLDVLVGDIQLDRGAAQLSGDRAAFAKLLEWFQRVDATATTIPAERTERSLAAL